MHGRRQVGTAGRPLDGLTSLRFVAALLVFLVHSSLFLYPLLPHAAGYAQVVFAGPAGVGFFFVLSGFVLTWSRRPDDSAAAFLRRRAARVLPNHALAWLFGLLLLLGLGAQVPALGGTLSALLLQAWVPRDAVFGAVNTPSWSLSCEVFFYALFPLLVVALSRLAPRRRPPLMAALVAVPLALALAQPAMAAALGGSAQQQNFFVYYFPPSRLAEFAVGILLALEVRDGRWPRVPVGLSSAAVLAALAVVDWTGQNRFHVVVTLVPVVALIGSVAMLDLSGRDGLLRRPALVRLGQWSYAFYLTHWLLLAWFSRFYRTPFPSSGVAAIAVLLLLAGCVAVSGLLFTLWERPWERRLRASHGPPLELRPLAAPRV